MTSVFVDASCYKIRFDRSLNRLSATASASSYSVRRLDTGPLAIPLVDFFALVFQAAL